MTIETPDSERMTQPKHRTIVLVKTSNGAGRLLIGTRDETKHPASLDRAAAEQRAYERLNRSNPDENPADWTTEEEEGDDGQEA